MSVRYEKRKINKCQHFKLCSAVLQLLAFPGESNLNFLCTELGQESSLIYFHCTDTHNSRKEERETGMEPRRQTGNIYMSFDIGWGCDLSGTSPLKMWFVQQVEVILFCCCANQVFCLNFLLTFY